MTRVYLHIGTHKTGTTYIQNVLYHNRDILLAKGYLYPSYGRGVGFRFADCGHHNLAWELTKDKNKAYNPAFGGWDELHQEILSHQPKNIILSSEAFCALKINEILQIKNYLSDFDTKILIYLRRQDTYFESLYSQAVKTAKYWESFSKFVLERESLGDYYKLIEPWKNVFGKDNIIINVYSKKKFNKSLINDFVTSIDLPIKENEFQINKGNNNVSPDDKTIKMMQIINKFIFSKLPKRKGKLKQIYCSTLEKENNLILKLVSLIPDSLINPILMSEQERINLIKKYDESNHKIVSEYLDGKNCTLFDLE